MFFFCKQKTAYEMRISDWSSDVCSSDLLDDRDALPIWQRQLAQRESRYWRDERAISTDVPEDWSQRPALLRALEITARRARADRTITPWLAVPALLRSLQITQAVLPSPTIAANALRLSPPAPPANAPP